MKVVLAYNYDPSLLRTGGGIAYVHNLLKGLLARGHEVTLFGVALAPVQEFRHPRFRFVPVLRGSDGFFRFVAALRLRLRMRPHDVPPEAVIHAHHPVVLACFGRRFPRNPKVCTFHGVTLHWVDVNHPRLSGLARRLYIPVERRVLGRAAAITTAGGRPLEELKLRHPGVFARTPAHVTPSGIDLARFRLAPQADMRRRHGLPEGAPVLVFAGRFSAQKDLPLLLQAYEALLRTVPDARLALVGRGPEDAAVRRRAAEMGLAGAVFMGEVAPAAVPELLACADVVALTSAYEASPTIVKEALACGVPVVSTDVGDVRTILRPPYGSVAGRDPVEVAQALARALAWRRADPGGVAAACRRLAEERFGFDAICDDFLRIYAASAADRGAQGLGAGAAGTREAT